VRAIVLCCVALCCAAVLHAVVYVLGRVRASHCLIHESQPKENPDDLVIKVCAKDLVIPRNFALLNGMLDIVDNKSFPCVWVANVMEALNQELDGRLFPAGSNRELTNIAVSVAAGQCAALTYLRKLKRNTSESKNASLQALKAKAKVKEKPKREQEAVSSDMMAIEYPRNDDDDDDDDEFADDTIPETPVDVLVAKCPEWLKELGQAQREEILDSFVQEMQGPEMQHNFSARATTLIALGEKFSIKAWQAEAICEFLGEAHKQAVAGSGEIVIDSSDDDDDDDDDGPGPRGLNSGELCPKRCQTGSQSGSQIQASCTH